MEIHTVENRQKGITKAYRNDKKNKDNRERVSNKIMNNVSSSSSLWTESSVGSRVASSAGGEASAFASDPRAFTSDPRWQR